MDNVDKDKKIGSLFQKKAMFKKWYLTGLMGLFDFMLVNGRIAWNMSVTDERCSHRRLEFRCIVAHQMLQYRDMKCGDLIAESILASSKNRDDLSNHKASIAERATRVRCCVCRVEDGIQNIPKQTSVGRQKMEDVLGISSAFCVKKSSLTSSRHDPVMA